MNGSREMGKPPWDVALLANVRALEARVTDAENERTQLLVDNHQLNQKLRQCRERQRDVGRRNTCESCRLHVSSCGARASIANA